MAKKLWNKCKKCGCEKIENTDKLCESCKRKRKEFWDKVKVAGGVVACVVIGVVSTLPKVILGKDKNA